MRHTDPQGIHKMQSVDLRALPHMLYAHGDGRIFDHPHLRIVGFSGRVPMIPEEADLMPMPKYSKLFFIPDCPPIGLDPDTGECEVLSETEIDGVVTPCNAVAAFLEPGLVRTYLPAVHYDQKSFVLPTWAYAAVGFKKSRYWAAAFRIEYSERWDPKNYDDRKLVPAIQKYQRRHLSRPLVDHLINCATNHHCFAAKNLFFRRWEAPLPVSRACNASCLGCLSLQPDFSCEPAHHRISFTPSVDEIVEVAVGHLNQATRGIVSFGQGCEGEPLTEYRLIAEGIKEIRKRTERGTINLNTNGSSLERVREIAESGLDSIRISLNSACPDLYRAYYRPRNYEFQDVVDAIALSKELGLYTMVNYLVFPGVTDREEEVEALRRLIRGTGVNFLHLKNLNIDPQVYLEHMPTSNSPALGMRKMVEILSKEFPSLKLGYFNQAVR